MAKKATNSKDVNYKITQIRKPLSRNELNSKVEELRSDDDFINYHLDNIMTTNNKYLITVMNDEFSSPKKNSVEERSYGFMKIEDAADFMNEYIDQGKASSKPKEVMRNGYSKKSKEKYDKLVEQEFIECKDINEFTKPTFDEIMNNIYMNSYNGETYHEKDEDIPDEIREDVGVIIPGLIESQEEYFAFVQRLKDRGKGGLGRSIYEKYEDYLEAVDLIETYTNAVYNKYGGIEEYYNAKDLGGMFGAYEYLPNIKPRFKKSLRNIKLDRGMNLNELANVKDMGARIRAEYEDEIEQLEIDDSFVEYMNTPPNFKDLPAELKLMYKEDNEGNNGFTTIKRFKTMEEHANKMVRSGIDTDISKGYELLDMLEKEKIIDSGFYKSEFVDILDESTDLNIKDVVQQLDYDKKIHEEGLAYADSHFDMSESFKVFKEYMINYIADMNGYNKEDPRHKSQIEEMAEYASKYMFNPYFRHMEDEKKNVNSAGDVLYRNSKIKGVSPNERDRENSRANESKIEAYIRKLATSVESSLSMMSSNADTSDYKGNSNTPTISKTEITGGIDTTLNGFELNPNASELVKYMKNNEELSKRIYELSSDMEADDMFSPRTNLSEFAEKASKTTKPFMTDKMLENAMNNIKRGVK